MLGDGDANQSTSYDESVMVACALLPCLVFAALLVKKLSLRDDHCAQDTSTAAAYTSLP